jgi:hypothetical protein
MTEEVLEVVLGGFQWKSQRDLQTIRGEAVPVRKKLLLILPQGDEYEYLCTRCGSSIGIKLEKGNEKIKVLI